MSVAALLVAVPAEFVNTASYSLPFSAGVVRGDRQRVRRRTASIGRDHVVPPSVETCHCTVGAGVPDADAVNVAVAPAVTV